MNLTAYFRRHSIRSITEFPKHIGGFQVLLKVGGPAGYGETVEQALADARAKNAEWLGDAA